MHATCDVIVTIVIVPCCAFIGIRFFASNNSGSSFSLEVSPNVETTDSILLLYTSQSIIR